MLLELACCGGLWHMLNFTPWSESDTESLKTFWGQGYSGTKISLLLNGKYSRCAVLGKADRLGLPPRDPTMNRRRSDKNMTGGNFKPKASPAPVMPPHEIALGPVGDFPGPGLCRFPMNPEGSPFQCCGRPGFPWCPEHHRACHSPKPAAKL